MGYTHYWRHNRDFTVEEWNKLTEFMNKALPKLPVSSRSAGGYHRGYSLKIRGPWGDGEPLVNDEVISFNGDRSEDMDHETMHLTAKKEKFSFCKTARKPYDLLVCALLLASSEIAPGALDVSSDGDMKGEEWQPAREFLKELSSK